MLPKELEDIIFEYVSPMQKLFVTKEYYNQYHHIFKYNIGDNYDNYVRDMIRNDCDFALNKILEQDYNLWMVKKNVSYKNTHYYNYVNYILALCIDFSATKCRNQINLFYENKGLSKNLHKKNRNNNKRWIR
tara:strand:+ start:229 stop:624 length:396 start_codon:yes stop_codon:yes gene_type:complete